MRVHSRTRPRGENGSYWTSYSDMMAGLMLVFALVMFFSIFQFLDLQEKKTVEIATKEAQLSEQQSILIAQESELADKEALLQVSLEDLEAAQTLLSEQEDLLAQSTLQLAQQQEEYDEQNALLLAAQQTIDAAQLSLTEQQQRLDAQETELSAQRELMDQQQVKIDNLVGLRARIIQALSEELRKANLDAVVDRQTGAIALQGAVLFDTGSDALKESGMQLLNEFVPVYVRTLLAEENREYVGEIIIEGHADTVGDYLSNLNLSQRRALAVATYCLQDGFGGLNAEERELLRNIMTANGRSWSNPIYYEDGTVNKEASRRVEFKFRLKDAEMIEEMSQILETLP